MKLYMGLGVRGALARPLVSMLRVLPRDEVTPDMNLKFETANLRKALVKQREMLAINDWELASKHPLEKERDDQEQFMEDFYSERVLLVGIASKKDPKQGFRTLQDALSELRGLAETAGLQVAGQTHQMVDSPSPSTYIGSGKVQELVQLVNELHVSTVIFDEELSPVQLMNLEKALGSEVRVCDRTALILDIFSQRAQSKEGQLQVELAQYKYQFPRLTRMWTHLERQAGGSGGDQAVKGMGEKQIEIDKRILKRRIISVTKELEEVKTHRRLARNRRAENDMPVIALVGYTNAGKSTLLNILTNSEVLVEDKLFATLDPTTRKLKLPNGKTALLSDTVGFIQKLPQELMAAFSATLEELQDSSLLLHVMDISSPHAQKQEECVRKVLESLGVGGIPLLSVWNKADQLSVDQRKTVLSNVKSKSQTCCVSAQSGEGLLELLGAIERMLEESMIPVYLQIPYKHGELVEIVYSHGVVKSSFHFDQGTCLEASVPMYLANQLKDFQVAHEDLKNLEKTRYTAKALFDL